MIHLYINKLYDIGYENKESTSLKLMRYPPYFLYDSKGLFFIFKLYRGLPLYLEGHSAYALCQHSYLKGSVSFHIVNKALNNRRKKTIFHIS